MEREFIILPEFDKSCKRIGLSDEDVREIEEFLCINPDFGDLIKGTGGLRKMRWALKGRGKSGGARIIYIDFISYEKIYFVTAYKKNEKDNLSKEEQNILKKLVIILEKQVKEG